MVIILVMILFTLGPLEGVNVMYVSDCCGVEIVDDIAGLELCPRCWEHCDVVIEDDCSS